MAHENVSIAIEAIYHELFQGDSLNHYPSNAIDPIVPGELFLGNRSAALSLETLRVHGITHVVNVAQGEGPYRVDTDAKFYEESNVTFLGIPAEDASFYDIATHFPDTTDFIGNAIRNEGKVLVHCREGYSRAPTIVCAYLMMSRGMDLLTCLTMINKNRKICPNTGFIEQLMELQTQLRQHRFERDFDT